MRALVLGPLVLAAAVLGAAAPVVAAPVATSAPATPSIRVAVPDVALVDQRGRMVELRSLLDHDGPVVLQLVFTSCPAVCPLLTGTAVAAARKLDDVERAKARFVAVSIDPEHDTPARLAAYAARFGADAPDLAPRFVFLTGTVAQSHAVQQAFGADRGDKMRHEPLTFVRPRWDGPWRRLAGYPTADELVALLRDGSAALALGAGSGAE